MKILAFVDLHGSLKALDKVRQLYDREKPDVVVCAGDASIFEQNLDYILQRISKFKVPVLVIQGNHEDVVSMRRACSRHDNTIFMHGQAKAINGVLFLGWGGGGFSTRDEILEKKQKVFEKVMQDYSKVVLITHAPPHNTKLDRIIDENCGSKTLRNFIKKHTKKILLAVSGHLHENEGKEDHISETRVVNPGPYGRVMNV